jgi:endonuclease-3
MYFMASVTLLGRADSLELLKGLEKAYQDAHYYLDFKTPIDLLVAAIISAQTRDETVNKITPALFSKYKTASDYARAGSANIAAEIKSVSFAGNKAKNIIGACKKIEQDHNGKVPDTMEELTTLPGIGRKTANTILINAYNKVEGIPVDTWVIRLSYRLGLSLNKNPDKIESDLKGQVPKRYWHNIAYVLKKHGKTICGAVPVCSKCPVNNVCPKNGVTNRP